MELDHVIMEAGKSKICRLGQQAGDPVEFHSEFKGSVQQNQEELKLQTSFKGGLMEKFFLEEWSGAEPVFCFIQAFN